MSKPSVCLACGGVLQLGIAHSCTRLSNGGYFKLLLPFAGLILLQLGGAIWWASGVQNDLHQMKDQMATQESYFKEQLTRQQSIIDRLDSYFRRPLP